MFTFRRCLPLSAFIVFLVSCTVATSTSVSDSITPASTVDDLERTSTYTAHPSSTLTPSATPNQTQVAEGQIATQGVAMLRTKIADFPRFCTEDYYYVAAGRFSPNGLWLEELCYSEEDQDLVLTLASRETQALWKFRYQDYIPPMDFVPDGGMSVIHWSSDEKYAYFTSFLGGDGGECFFGNQLDTGSGLFRVDLETGNAVAILPVGGDYLWYSFSLSPTDRRLVYGARSLDLKVLDLQTGQLTNVAHMSDFSQGGQYIWSPDGLKFVYSTVLYEEQQARLNYSIRLVDAQSGTERILLESPDACFAVTSWTENNILTLEKNYGQTLAKFDLNTNKIISEATLTP